MVSMHQFQILLILQVQSLSTILLDDVFTSTSILIPIWKNVARMCSHSFEKSKYCTNKRIGTCIIHLTEPNTIIIIMLVWSDTDTDTEIYRCSPKQLCAATLIATYTVHIL